MLLAVFDLPQLQLFSWFCDSVILGDSDHLGFELPLAFVGLGVEPAPKYCSSHWFKQEGNHTPCCVGVAPSLDLGDPLFLGVMEDILASSSVIKGVFKYLGGEVTFIWLGCVLSQGPKSLSRSS